MSDDVKAAIIDTSCELHENYGKLLASRDARIAELEAEVAALKVPKHVPVAESIHGAHWVICSCGATTGNCNSAEEASARWVRHVVMDNP